MAVCCCDDDGPYYGPAPFIPLNDMKYFYIDNSNEFPKALLTDSAVVDTVNRNAFGLQLSPGGFFMAANSCKSDNFSLFSSAYACSCGGYYVEASQYLPIDSFSIKTLVNYNTRYPQGSELNSMVRILNQNDFATIPALQWQLDPTVNLLFMEPADSVGEYQFEISYRVNDTLRINDTTKLIYLF